MVKKYYDSIGYKALRIVLINFIEPCIKAAEKKQSIIMQRWWRKINGCYNGFNLIDPNLSEMSLPPGLWRQYNTCQNRITINNYNICKKIPIRWLKKLTRDRINTRDIQRFIEMEHRKGNYYLNYIDLENKYKTRFNKYSNAWNEPLCVCNNKPAKIIINYHKKYNKMSLIFRELASDRLTFKTRNKVSLYVRNRLFRLKKLSSSPLSSPLFSSSSSETSSTTSSETSPASLPIASFSNSSFSN
jgi:hypothetical protein